MQNKLDSGWGGGWGGRRQNTKSQLTDDLIFREVRLFKEKSGYMKAVAKLAQVNLRGPLSTLSSYLHLPPRKTNIIQLHHIQSRFKYMYVF